MSRSTGDAAGEQPSRDCEGALVPSSGDTSKGQNNAKGHKDITAVGETPPKTRRSKRDISPKDVMDVAEKSFQAGVKGEEGVKADDRSKFNSLSSKDTTAGTATNPESTTEDPGVDTSSIVSRVRARSASKPQRYRQSAESESPEPPAKAAKKASPATSQQKKKKSTPKKAASGTKGGWNHTSSPSKSAGAWTDEEHMQFEEGCVLYGWGNWTNVQLVVPTRSRDQVKSHAQKFLKHHQGRKKMMDKQHIQYLKLGEEVYEKKTKKRKPAGENKPKSSPEKAEVSKRPKRSKPALSPESTSSKSASPSKKSNASKQPVKKATSKVPPAKKAKPSAKKSLAKSLPTKALKITEKAKVDDTGKEVHDFTPKCPPKSKPDPRTISRNRASANNKIMGTGSWTDFEHLQFEKGCVLYGWGNWKDIQRVVPTRTIIQIKSHGQKIKKHRPAEKERLDREHKLSKKKKAQEKTKSTKKKAAVKRLPLVKNRGKKAPAKAPAAPIDQPTSPIDGWTPTEMKQFEDGCIYHGWGKWDDLSSHIHTKNVPEVKAYAATFTAEDVVRLKHEHALNFPERAAESSEEDEAPMDDDESTTSVNHVLLGRGGKKPKSVSKSPQKTTGEDMDAAEAIMALNFSNWDNSEEGASETASETEAEKSKPSADEDEQKVTATTEAMSKSSQGDDAREGTLADSKEKFLTLKVEDTSASDGGLNCQDSEGVANMPVFDRNEEEEDADADDSKEPRKPLGVSVKDEDDAPKEVEVGNSEELVKTSVCDGNDNALKKETSEPNVNGAPTMAESTKVAKDLSTAPAAKKEEVKVDSKATGQYDISSKSQPPPNWLAADGTWEQCLTNIQRWNGLTAKERKKEYSIYNRLSFSEKEKLRRKLVVLMNDRPASIASFT